MAIFAGALVKGMIGGAVKGAVKGGAKRVVTNKLLNRRKKRGGREEIQAGEGQPTIGEGRSRIRPSSPLVPESFSSSPQQITEASSSPGKTETLEGTALRIKHSVVQIDNLLKGSLVADKVKDDVRKQRENDKRDIEEKELEKQSKNRRFERFIPKPVKSLWGRLVKFISTLFFGWIALQLVDQIPLLLNLVKALNSVANFIVNWGGKFFNAIISFIDFGYSLYDGLAMKIEEQFGPEGLKNFENLTSIFNKMLNAALIAVLVAGRISWGIAAARGFGFRGGGFTRVGGARGVKPSVVSRYASRFGRQAAIKRFGKKAVQKYGGQFARSAGTKLLRKGVVSLLGKQGSKQFLKVIKRFISPVVRRIPFVGALIDFALNVFVFKESLGKSAFKAIGAGIGAWIGGAIGTLIPVPVVGTLIGAFLGGMGGDLLGGWIYDTIFGKKDPTSELQKSKSVAQKPLSDSKEKKKKWGRGPLAIFSTIDWLTGGLTDLDQMGSEWNLFNWLVKDRESQKGENEIAEGGVPSSSPEISTPEREVSARFDMNTGKGYINEKEVLMDEYLKFQNMSDEEKLKHYGKNTPGSLDALNKADYSGIVDVLENYAEYEMMGGEPKTIIVNAPSSTSGKSGTGPGLMNDLMIASLSQSGGGGIDPYERTYKGT